MNKYFKKALILSVFLSFLPIFTEASIIRTDKEAIIQNTETLEDNVYLIGNEPNLLGSINGDLISLGNNINIEGKVSEDILTLGGEIKISGEIKEDVRVFGATINVDGNIDGDLLAVGGDINISEKSNIKGEIILIGAKVNIGNKIDNHLRVIAGDTFISGSINNTANITSEKINILDGADIKGSLNYFSPRQAVVDEGSKVSGSVNFNKIDSIRENGLVKHSIVSFLNFWMLFRFITTLLMTFMLVYIFKIFSQKVTVDSMNNFGKSFLVGLATTFLIPAVIIICFVSLILIPISVLLMMFYIGIFIISTSVASIFVGVLIRKAFTKNKSMDISFQTATIGVIILTLLQFVPFVGDLTRFVLMLTAFGSIWIYFYEKIRWGEKNVLEKK